MDYVITHYYYLFSPISTSLILFLGITGLAYSQVIICMLPVVAIMVIITLYYLRSVPNGRDFAPSNKTNPKEIWKSLYYILPIIITIIFAIATNYLIIGIIAGIIISLLMIRGKISIGKIFRIKYGLLIILIIILFFKEILIHSKISDLLGNYFINLGIHPVVLIITIGFMSGFILGSSKNMVLLSFPLAMPFIPADQLLSYAILLYISDFAGYMSSPAHTCPTIAREYFKVDLRYFYKHTAILSFFILLSGLITFFILQNL